MRAVAVLVLCVAVSSCAAPAVPATPPATETVAPNAFNVVVLGDSIAAGTGATSDSTRWWIRLQTALRAALPERSIVVKNSARAGSGLDYLERTATTVSPLAFQAAVIIEGQNDQTDDASWLSRYAAVVTGLEAKGIVVAVGTYPPTFQSGRLRAHHTNRRNSNARWAETTPARLRTAVGAKRSNDGGGLVFRRGSRE